MWVKSGLETLGMKFSRCLNSSAFFEAKFIKFVLVSYRRVSRDSKEDKGAFEQSFGTNSVFGFVSIFMNPLR